MDKLQYFMVPVPMEIPLNRGPYAINTHKDTTRAMKFSPVHDAQILAAANKLDIPFTTFVRWCAIHGADAVLKGEYYDKPEGERKDG
jgi:hypothetical protein